MVRKLSMALAFLVLFTSSIASAQGLKIDPVVFDKINVVSTSPAPVAGAKVAMPTDMWLAFLGMNTAMIADGHTTFAALAKCDGIYNVCDEGNPVQRLVTRRGPVAFYVANTAAEAGIMVLANKMKHSNNRLLRRTWWVAPVTMMALHSYGAIHNSALQFH